MTAYKTRNIIKKMIPPGIRSYLKGITYGWHGNYKTWHEARSVCTGYDSEEILTRVRSSALKVKNRHGAFERDSVVFDSPDYSFPLLSSLLFVAARKGGKLNIIDFGGSLGSSYFQHKVFLDKLPEVNWCIVEQPGFVRAGKESFEDSRIRFYYSIEECLNDVEIDVILFSSVLQYLENPWALLDSVLQAGFSYIIIDRMPFTRGGERITVQRVNPRIYRASYPCRFFNKKEFSVFMSRACELLVEWKALDRANIRSEFCGFLFENTSKK